MKKVLSLALLFIGIAVASYAQSNPLDKKLEKAKELYQNGKTADADKYVEEIVAKNPDFGDGWDMLCKIRYKEYEDSKSQDNLFNNLTISTKDKNGKDVKIGDDDTLSQKLKTLLTSFKPSQLAYDKFLYTTRKATLLSREAYSCSMYIRLLNVDKEVDTNVNKKALKYFSDAEKEFANKNLNAAAKLYKRAIEEQPDFYKASLYLGDCFYFQQNYPDAATYFKEAVNRFPMFLEPRKFLVDAYMKGKLFDKALDESINTFAVYPDYDMFQKMEDCVYMANKKLAISWMPRGVFPNQIVDTSEGHMRYSPSDDKHELKASGPWTYYQAALKKVSPYCDSKGLITKPNGVTTSKYLEVYSWEEMLKNSTDPSLEMARKMQRDGYLDCYVMVTCFHYDFYDQYLDFAKKNKERITAYYKRYITSM